MKNIFKKLIVGSFLVISVLGVFATGCKKTTANIPVNGNEEPLKPIESPITDGDGNDLSGNKIYEMPQSMVFSAPALQAATNANEVTVTATVTPADATDKSVDWSVAFKTASSAWAVGKTVTDYVTVTPTSDGALSAKVTCKRSFGEQIILTCSSRAYPAVKADCTVNYKQSVSYRVSSTTSFANGTTAESKEVKSEFTNFEQNPTESDDDYLTRLQEQTTAITLYKYGANKKLSFTVEEISSDYTVAMSESEKKGYYLECTALSSKMQEAFENLGVPTEDLSATETMFPCTASSSDSKVFEVDGFLNRKFKSAYNTELSIDTEMLSQVFPADDIDYQKYMLFTLKDEDHKEIHKFAIVFDFTYLAA